MTGDLQEVLKSGEWWRLGGWEDERILAHLPFSKEEIKVALDTLKQVFTPKWFLQNIEVHEPSGVFRIKHPLIHFMIMGGVYPLAFLVELGLNMRALKSVKGYVRLIRRLKRDGKNFYSALPEVRVGSQLAREFEVEIPEKGPVSC